MISAQDAIPTAADTPVVHPQRRRRTRFRAHRSRSRLCALESQREPFFQSVSCSFFSCWKGSPCTPSGDRSPFLLHRFPSRWGRPGRFSREISTETGSTMRWSSISLASTTLQSRCSWGRGISCSPGGRPSLAWCWPWMANWPISTGTENSIWWCAAVTLSTSESTWGRATVHLMSPRSTPPEAPKIASSPLPTLIAMESRMWRLPRNPASESPTSTVKESFSPRAI